MADGTTIYITGGSHLEAIGRGTPLVGSEISVKAFSFFDPNFQPGVVYSDGHFVYNQKLVDALANEVARRPPDCIVAAIGNSNDFEIGAIKMPAPFDFVDPDDDGDGSELAGQLVPHDILVKHFAHIQRLAMEFIGWVRPFYGGPVIVPSVPPPIASQERLAAFIPPSWREDMEKNGLNSPAFRRKLWKTNTKAMEQEATKAGAIYLPPPLACFDTDGSLSERFVSDAFHGNADYGRLIVEQVLDRFKSSEQ
ncbi:hypothetical protein L2A60_03090 [Acidiphilium iwatense]|uniref:SGNH hydrolase-type esterase domain-containing protein n=2 Tax=Acidiphilium iwatense TaxID=768198 RepID=A0ABS9DV82_9PROT|nr:hypothetical protein [Acidiphilium iwatense]